MQQKMIVISGEWFISQGKRQMKGSFEDTVGGRTDTKSVAFVIRFGNCHTGRGTFIKGKFSSHKNALLFLRNI